MNGILLIKMEKRENMINLENVVNVGRRVDDGCVEVRIDYVDDYKEEFYNHDAEAVWEALQEGLKSAKFYGKWPVTLEVNLCGSAATAAGEMVGGAGGLVEEDPGLSRCRNCGRFLRDHLGGMDCSLCLCESFEYEPDTHRCNCNLVVETEGGE